MKYEGIYTDWLIARGIDKFSKEAISSYLPWVAGYEAARDRYDVPKQVSGWLWVAMGQAMLMLITAYYR